MTVIPRFCAFAGAHDPASATAAVAAFACVRLVLCWRRPAGAAHSLLLGRPVNSMVKTLLSAGWVIWRLARNLRDAGKRGQRELGSSGLSPRSRAITNWRDWTPSRHQVPPPSNPLNAAAAG